MGRGKEKWAKGEKKWAKGEKKMGKMREKREEEIQYFILLLLGQTSVDKK